MTRARTGYAWLVAAAGGIAVALLTAGAHLQATPESTIGQARRRRRSSPPRRPRPDATSTRRGAPPATRPTWAAATRRRRWPGPRSSTCGASDRPFSSPTTSAPRCHPADRRSVAADALAVTAFILASNGAPAGATPLAAGAAVPIGSVASATQAPAAAAPVPMPPAPTAATPRQTTPPPRGHYVMGQVPRFSPVTDAMLRTPPPGDWLMARRTYQAWSHSPLDDITPANVGSLRLAWVWNMNEGGSNQAMPLVHDGIVYLTNTMNEVQALDGATGDLIWANQVGPNRPASASGGMRNLAIYDDKIYLATGDARLVALDARTGATVWTAIVADGTKGFSNTSGPIVVKGKVIQGLGGCDRYRVERCYISAWDAKTGAPAWKFHTVAHAGEPGGDTWNNLPDMMRQGGETWIAGSYDPGRGPHLLGHRPGQAVDAGEPRHPRVRRRPAHGVDGGAQPRHRRAGLALPAPAGRDARPRRGLREGGGRRRHRRRRCSRSASRASCGSSIARPARSSTSPRRSSRTSTPTSTARPAGPPTAATSWSRRSTSGCRRARAPRAATTGRR